MDLPSHWFWGGKPYSDEELSELLRITRFQPNPPPIAPPPPPHWLRIYSWNINGIQPFIQPSIGAFIKPVRPSIPRADAPITTSLRNFLRRHHWPQLVHLQEVKINPSDESTRRSVENAVNLCRSGADEGPRYQVRFCLPKDRYNANGMFFCYSPWSPVAQSPRKTDTNLRLRPQDLRRRNHHP